MNTPDQIERPEIKTLVEMGNGIGGIKVSATDRASTRVKIEQALTASKARSQRTKPDKDG